MTELSDYIRCVSGPNEKRLTQRIRELSSENEALAQSNRRLREGLEKIDEVAGNPITSAGSPEHRLNVIRDMIRETLKDNGHG